jgi:hypothetical protein
MGFNTVRLRPYRLAQIPQLQLNSVSVSVGVTLRLTVYCQSVRLGANPLESHDQQPLFFNSTFAVIVLT